MTFISPLINFEIFIKAQIFHLERVEKPAYSQFYAQWVAEGHEQTLWSFLNLRGLF